MYFAGLLQRGQKSPEVESAPHKLIYYLAEEFVAGKFIKFKRAASWILLLCLFAAWLGGKRFCLLVLAGARC